MPERGGIPQNKVRKQLAGLSYMLCHMIPDLDHLVCFQYANMKGEGSPSCLSNQGCTMVSIYCEDVIVHSGW